MDTHGGEIRVGLHHRDELLVGVGVLRQFRHLNHKGRENLLLKHLGADRKLALHQRIPLLKAIDGLDVGLDVHLAVSDLGVVDVVLARDDVNLVA